jgi:acetate kinase
MAMAYFIINVGSSSKRYALYKDTTLLLQAHFEKTAEGFSVTLSEKQTYTISKHVYKESIYYLLTHYKDLFIDNALSIGIRIVAPGTYFTKTRRITPAFEQKLKASLDKAPLHTALVLDEIKALKKHLSYTLLLGISDSAFHSALPYVSKVYAFPPTLTKQLDIYRFGYHGISLQSILRKLTSEFGSLPEKIIVCHLGSGSSITALKNGKSIDTSMGFSPLEGLPMQTRSGNFDPAIIAYMNKELHMSVEKLRAYTFSECGLKALSTTSGDMRLLLSLEKKGNKSAHNTIEYYIYAIQKYIGAYITALEGLNLLVFTGGIGEHSAQIRSRICKKLVFWGILLDDFKNSQTNTFIEHEQASIKLAVLATDEIEDMLLITQQFNHFKK